MDDTNKYKLNYGTYSLKTFDADISTHINKVQQRNKCTVLEKKSFWRIYILFENNVVKYIANISATKY